MNNYSKWIELKSEIRKLTEQLHEVESDIYIHARELNELNLSGSKSFRDEGYKINVAHKQTYKVEQDLAIKRPELFKVKFEMDKKKYDLLGKDDKLFVDESITISSNKPSFSIERI